MATADVIKPDYGSQRRHFIFTDEHDLLRESIRRFAVNELQPHAEEWEETTFPDSVFRRMGELGFLGLDKPVEYGGQGGDYYSSLVLAEELVHSHSGGRRSGYCGAHRHGDAADPGLRDRGAETRVAGARDRRREDPLPRDHRARRRLRRGGDQDPRRARSADRRVRDQRIEDVHHQRRPRRPDRTFDKDRSRRRLRGSHAVPCADGPARRDSREAPGEARNARLRHRAAGIPGRSRAGLRGSRRDRQRLLPHHVGTPGGAADRGGSAVAGAQVVFDRTLRYATERHAFGRPIGTLQGIRWKFAEMATKLETARQLVYTAAWRVGNGDYPVREISMAKLHAARVAVEVADECIQIHGGAGYMREYGIERAWRDLRMNRIAAGTDEIMLDVIGRSYGL